MVRTKADAGSSKVSVAKAPRKILGGVAATSSSSSPCRSGLSKENKYAGGNSYNPQPTPAWQKEISSFFKTGSEPEKMTVGSDTVSNGEPMQASESSKESPSTSKKSKSATGKKSKCVVDKTSPAKPSSSADTEGNTSPAKQSSSTDTEDKTSPAKQSSSADTEDAMEVSENFTKNGLISDDDDD